MIEPKYDKEKFLRVVRKDMYLSFMWADMQKRAKPEHKDSYLEALFNSEVLENSVMAAEYEKA